MTEYCDECGARLPNVPSGPGQARRLAEYCDECGARVLTTDYRDDLRNWSERVQEMGAEKFGEQWMMVNQCAVDAAAVLGIDASNHLLRALLSETCYRILVRLTPTATSPKDAENRARRPKTSEEAYLSRLRQAVEQHVASQQPSSYPEVETDPSEKSEN
jgi:hypothetical protein